MATMTGSPQNFTRCLQGIQFPCNRDDLIRYARNQGATDDILQAMNGLPDRRYDDLQDVMRAYGQFDQDVDVDQEFEVNVDEEDTEEVQEQQQQRRRA